MLSHLYIRDFAIVPRMELGFEPGLTVLTGETGAGKSILIDALTFALGERADSTMVRHGCEQTEIIASFELPADHDAARWLERHELFDDRECVLRRVIDLNKPSRAYINSRPVPLQMLRELGDLLVDVHGQHEHQSLLKRGIQRQILDDYAGLTEQARTLADHYETLRGLESRLEALRRQSADRGARLELLQYQARELEALDLEENEVPRLEEEHRRLANGAELLQGVQAVAYALYDDEENALSTALAQALNRLQDLSEHDPRLGDTIRLLNEAAINIDEAASQLHHYSDGLELDPQRLAWLDERLALLHDLARKHRVRPEELPAVLARLQQELADMEDADTSLARLEQELHEARERYDALARTLSKERRRAAESLGEAVSGHMQELGMPGGVFRVELIPLADGEISAGGLERTEFLVSANPGQPARPLTKVASGGELSRISLALQVVIAGLGRIPTLIFDEVDVGVGGGVAEIVGRQLRELGRTRQVLCITHLAQVAAQGDRHLQVSKRRRGDTTETVVQPLPEPERVQEIARMLGGVQINQATLAHAEDMLHRASA